jgi:prophage maintenance system killer protein
VTTLDVADLVVIAGRALGIGADAALAQVDVPAAEAALAEAALAGESSAGQEQPGAPFPDRTATAAAGIGLVHALLRHRPFPQHGEQVAVAAGLQFLSLNGWQADLDPPATAAVVVEALASGRLSPDNAAAWLSPRLSPNSAPRAGRALMRVPLPGLPSLPSLRPLRTLPVAFSAVGRMLVSAVLALTVGGLALLATACARGPAAPAAHQGGQPPAVRQSSRPERAQATGLAWAACTRAQGTGNLPGLSAADVLVITPPPASHPRACPRP